MHGKREEIARLWLPLLLTSLITVPSSLLASAALAAPLSIAPSLALAMVRRPPPRAHCNHGEPEALGDCSKTSYGPG